MRRWMIKSLFGVFVLGTSTMAVLAQEPSQPAPAAKVQGPRIMQLVILNLGPAWVKEKPPMQQPGIKDHGEYMGKLIKEGTLVIGGPLLENPNALTINGAVMILAVDSPDAAREILEKDPAHVSGLFEIVQIRPLMVTGASWRPPQTQ